MPSHYDLIVRNGTVVDGTGAAPSPADVAIKDGVIAAIGRIDGSAAKEIDATGKLVTPGFVDIHTHYDAQAIWDSHLAPSSLHGGIDAAASELRPQPGRQVQAVTLRGGVVAEVGGPGHSRRRRHDDDPAAPPRGHLLPDDVRQHERGAAVQIQRREMRL